MRKLRIYEEYIMTKKLKSNLRILVMLLLVFSLSTTACGTDKTVKKEANKI